MERRVCGSLLVSLILVILVIGTDTSSLLRRQKRIVGGIEAAQPPEDDPVVFVTKNERDARIYGSRDPKKGFYVFRGIRFGEPPVGRNRFQRPRAANLEGEFNATMWGPPCPQPDKDNHSKVIGTEDCLFLNVFTPALPDGGDGYPVLIWIHGGGFRRGAACQYEMRNLIKKKMIVVSIQFRLGALGFLSTGTKELPGNNGLFDMTLAVNWVKEYISFFGGNPNKIIAFGHGTGASSALMLSLSKLSKHIFSGLIAMSGSILSQFAVDKDPLSSTKEIASANNCPIDDIPEMIRCLQEIRVENLIRAESKLERIKTTARGFLSGLSSLLGTGPVVDGEDDERSLPNFMTDTPENALKLGNFPKIPLLTGVLKDETGGAIFGKYKDEVQKKLKTIPNFLNNDLVRSLQGTVANFGNKTQQFVPKAFNNYLNVLGKGEGLGDIGKVAEATGDALFNAPAFLTVDSWSKQAKTFLYSFDHKGKRNYGKDFLGGLPIVDAKGLNEEGPGHGDDLGYVFGRNSILGEEIAEDSSQDEEDERVTEVFTDMIAEFARNGEIGVPKDSNWLEKVVPRFSDNSNPFVSVSSKLQLMKDFRYCEMGLWTGLTERLQTSTCGLYKTTIEKVEKMKEGSVAAVQEVGKKVLNPASALENIFENHISNTRLSTASTSDRPLKMGDVIGLNIGKNLPKPPKPFGMINFG